MIHDTTNANRHRTTDEHASFTIDGGGIVVYDRDDPTAWIQCDDPVTLEDNA